MKLNKFDKSDIQVSQLGFGAWGIGKRMWRGAEDSESKKALLKAIDLGINFFDSALVYGNGHSERLIGAVEKEAAKELFVTSKIPSKKFEWPAKDESKIEESFPRDYIIQQTEKSLKNFNRDYIDLQQFHVWNDNWADRDEWKEAVYQLKKDGKVRFFGISMNDHQPENGIETARTGLIDSFQVIFNIFDQSPIEKLFPICLENRISVIARVPLDEGSLTGNIKPDTEFPRFDWRNNYFRDDRKAQVYQRAMAVWEDLKSETDTLVEGALRFTASFDAVTAVIPGMRKVAHVEDNVRTIEKGPLSDEMLDKLKPHAWIRNFYK